MAKKKSNSTAIYFKEKEIESLSDLIDISTDLSNEEWWFRGLRNKDYKLMTTFGRYLKENKSKSKFDEESKKLEVEIIEEFQARASSYIFSDVKDIYIKETVGGSEDIWFWLFTMQHHGIPTRLLDWTLSPIIGLWFALNDWDGYSNNKDTDAIFYAFNPTEYLNICLEGNITKIPFLYSKDPGIKPVLESYSPLENQAMRLTNQFSSLPLIGLYNNERIKAQKGRFTVSANPLHSIEDEIKKHSKNKDDAKRILKSYIIKKKNVPLIREEISALGLTYTDIIPDLSGVSKTFDYKLKK